MFKEFLRAETGRERESNSECSDPEILLIRKVSRLCSGTGRIVMALSKFGVFLMISSIGMSSKIVDSSNTCFVVGVADPRELSFDFLNLSLPSLIIKAESSDGTSVQKSSNSKVSMSFLMLS